LLGGGELTGKDGAPMVLVPEGEFLYGRDNQRISLPAFYIDRYEVTTSHYAKFLQTTGRPEPKDWPQQMAQVGSGNRPVVNVTWQDADAYCRYYEKRLPTVQEWEKAARGTDGRKYPWGNEAPTSRHANYHRDWNGYATLSQIGSYEAGKSPYGLYDMAGNVWEWTSSDFQDGRKEFRGGSWIDGEFNMSATHHGAGERLSKDTFIGFRCVQDAH
jgi:formylglycine-generating enzyme required for sulfatase activity